jgi:hypothetical protein
MSGHVSGAPQKEITVLERNAAGQPTRVLHRELSPLEQWVESAYRAILDQVRVGAITGPTPTIPLDGGQLPPQVCAGCWYECLVERIRSGARDASDTLRGLAGMRLELLGGRVRNSGDCIRLHKWAEPQRWTSLGR